MKFSLERFAFSGWRYVLAAIVIIAVGGYFFLGRGGEQGATLVVTRGDFREQVSVSGTVTATKDVELGFAANGRIAGIYAKVGQRVGAGAILAEIENDDLAASLVQKQSALEEAQAKLASLLAGTRPEEVAVASAAVESAKAALVDAIQSAYTASDDAVHNKVDAFFTNPRIDPKLSFAISNQTLKTTIELDRAAVETVLADWSLLVSRLGSANAADSARQAQTYVGRVITLLASANAAVNQGLPDPSTSAATLSSYASALATARSSVNVAATALTADINALDAAQKNLTLKQAGATSEDIAAQEASVAVTAADVQNVRAQLAKTRVTAPFGGIVTRMDAKVGEIVSPSTSEISMQSAGIFEIETFIPEVTIARVTPGNQATTTLDAYGSSIAFPSVVVAVDPAETVKDGVPTYKTMLSFLSEDARIRSGMTANVVIVTGTLQDSIVIPAGAVGQKDGASYVSVVDNGTVVSRVVATGPSPALGQAQILSGLSAGDVILLAPVP